MGAHNWGSIVFVTANCDDSAFRGLLFSIRGTIMAFPATGAQSMAVTFEDRDTNQSTVDFYVPSAAITADVATFATGSLITTLTGLSNASIRRVTLSRTYENDAFVTPPEESDVQRKGVFSWVASDRTKSRNEIPSIKNTLVLDGTDFLNSGDPLVQALITMVVDEGLIDVYGLGNYRGVKIVQMSSAPYKRHRKSVKG